jgi:hypothetical protein
MKVSYYFHIFVQLHRQLHIICQFVFIVVYTLFAWLSKGVHTFVSFTYQGKIEHRVSIFYYNIIARKTNDT